MVTKVYSNWQSKVTAIDITVYEINLKVDVWVSCVVNSIDSNNIGSIIENYRKYGLNDESFINEHKDRVAKYLRALIYPQTDFKPDCIICVYPSDKNRAQVLKCFKRSVKQHIENFGRVDFSSSFRKIDEAKSVVNDNLTEEDFELVIEGGKQFLQVLIIDDAVDKGTTVDILLALLARKQLITGETQVRLACIYNRPKMKQFGHFELFGA